MRHLHAKGIPICLATRYLQSSFVYDILILKDFFMQSCPDNFSHSSHKRHFEVKTQRHRELFSLLHHVVVGDDFEVKHGKPSPDIFLAAAKRFEVQQNKKLFCFVVM